MKDETATSLLPHPLLSLSILAVWLLLWESVSLGSIALGGALALIIPVFARRFWPDAPEVRRPGLLITYALIFAWDILKANLSVAALVLKPNDSLRPTFLEIPLEIDHPFLITILANTISLTPGTVSTNVTGDRNMLLVHCLHCEDPEEEIEGIKERYEQRLEEIFA
ncbi:MAG: Na+/H+ antiporter subunit E [Bradymonadaceae bacterium]